LCITDLKQLTEDVFSVYGYIRYEHKLEIIYLIIYRAGTINGSILAYCVLHQEDYNMSKNKIDSLFIAIKLKSECRFNEVALRT
jgi:hypothetical protein